MSRFAAIELCRDRLAQVRAHPEVTARFAAARIQENLIHHATTRRGNIPSYGAMGDVPIAVTVEGSSVHVSGPDWVLKLAQEKGQVAEWERIIIETSEQISSGILR